MKLTVREIQAKEIEKIVDYFVNADTEFLKGMGADKSKLPKKEWIENWNLNLKNHMQRKSFTI